MVVLNALEPTDLELMVEAHDETTQWAFGSGPMTVAGARKLIERARWHCVRRQAATLPIQPDALGSEQPAQQARADVVQVAVVPV